MEQVENVLNQVKKVIVGKDEEIKKMFMAILAKGHILLEDIPGVGKTTLALAFSKTIGLSFNRIQFTPDVTASDIVGFTIYNKEKDTFDYKKGVVFCNLLLGDEINRTSSRTQSALLEVMEEGNVTVDGHTYVLDKPFHVIATQNPNGTYGTQPLPAAQLERFIVKLKLGYPNFRSQVEMLKGRQGKQPLDQIETVLTAEGLVEMQEKVEHIHIEDSILAYITTLTEVTRNHPAILQGISPRGALAICRMAKAHAFMEGRSFVLPQDVKAIFIDTCSHRLMLNGGHNRLEEAEVSLLQEIIQSTKSPNYDQLLHA